MFSQKRFEQILCWLICYAIGYIFLQILRDLHKKHDMLSSSGGLTLPRTGFIVAFFEDDISFSF
jgi:hypothetical protein